MSDRIKGFVVTLEADVREDDAALIRELLERIRGVASVRSSVRDHNDLMNQERIKSGLRQKLFDVLG